MDFYQLEYFRKAAELNSIGRAAKELLVTQPAVSKQVKALEEELGEHLFDRIGKKVFLTRAGELLYVYADRILRSVSEAKDAVSDLSEKCSGVLAIGISDHIGLHRLPAVLKSYASSYPEVELKLHCHRSETILEMVLSNIVDLGVITIPRPNKKLITKKVWKDTMSLVVPKGHPLVRKGKIMLRDTAAFSMILPEAGTTTRSIISEEFAKKDITPRVSMEVAYIETIKMLVKVGLGISILPDKAVEDEIKAGTLKKVTVKDANFSRNLGLIHLKDKFLSRPAIEFIRILDRISKR
jgi:DNA-binding transcriptional LysR family regulator